MEKQNNSVCYDDIRPVIKVATWSSMLSGIILLLQSLKISTILTSLIGVVSCFIALITVIYCIFILINNVYIYIFFENSHIYDFKPVFDHIRNFGIAATILVGGVKIIHNYDNSIFFKFMIGIPTVIT